MSPLAKESPYIYPEHPKLKSKAPQVVGRPNLSCIKQAEVGRK